MEREFLSGKTFVIAHILQCENQTFIYLFICLFIFIKGQPGFCLWVAGKLLLKAFLFLVEFQSHISTWIPDIYIQCPCQITPKKIACGDRITSKRYVCMWGLNRCFSFVGVIISSLNTPSIANSFSYLTTSLDVLV